MAPDYSKGAVTPRSRLFIHAAYRELDHAFLGIARRLVRLARDEALVLYALPLDQALLGGAYALAFHLLDLGLGTGSRARRSWSCSSTVLGGFSSGNLSLK